MRANLLNADGDFVETADVMGTTPPSVLFHEDKLYVRISDTEMREPGQGESILAMLGKLAQSPKGQTDE